LKDTRHLDITEAQKKQIEFFRFFNVPRFLPNNFPSLGSLEVTTSTTSSQQENALSSLRIDVRPISTFSIDQPCWTTQLNSQRLAASL